MTDPLVSVIMPVYNAGPYLQISIDSIIAQQGIASWELILIEDGSTDGSREVARAAVQDARIILLENERNLGAYPARNRGIAAARGAFIAMQDADDVSLPERLAKQLALLQNDPRLNAVGAAADIIEEEGALVTDFTWHNRYIDPEAVRAATLLGPPYPMTSMFVRAEAMRALGGFSTAQRVSQDYDLWARLTTRGDVSGIDEPLVQVRDHASADRLTTRHRDAQLDAAFEVAARTAQQIIPRINLGCFRRMWFAGHGGAPVRDRDLIALRPFWHYVRLRPAWKVVWLEYLQRIDRWQRIAHTNHRDYREVLAIIDG